MLIWSAGCLSTPYQFLAVICRFVVCRVKRGQKRKARAAFVRLTETEISTANLVVDS